MQFRKDRTGRPISLLGYGCMRFSRSGGAIDLAKAEQEILEAVRLGVNYFDTAYIYPGSEEALGSIVQKNGLRDRINIATKLPQYLIRSPAAIDRYFDEQLRRLRTDHIDYYLMHMLTDAAAWQKLVDLGIRDWIERKKAEGAIRQIGFSFHGDTRQFLDILNAYDWDFCQIQYNYLDENTQAGRKGLTAAFEKHVPVIIMEPLRGGKLVTLLPEKARALIAADTKKRSPAELAFKWLFDQEAVTCVLSGMNSVEMVRENCQWADETLPGSLDEGDRQLYSALRDSIQAELRVPCTGCGYCMPCPQGVDIPGAFRCYNRMYTEGRGSGRKEYFQTVSLQKRAPFATQCVACGKCVSHCPQHIPIIEKLREADRALRPVPYRIASSVARRFLFRKDRQG